MKDRRSQLTAQPHMPPTKKKTLNNNDNAWKGGKKRSTPIRTRSKFLKYENPMKVIILMIFKNDYKEVKRESYMDIEDRENWELDTTMQCSHAIEFH